MAYVITAFCTGCTACSKICPVAAIRGAKGALHEIDPRSCIECGACGRVCPARAVLDDAGAVVERRRISEWQRPKFDLPACIGCACCVESCPVDCLVMIGGLPGGLGETPSLIRPSDCVSCERCLRICPVSCIVMSYTAGQSSSVERAVGEGLSALPREARGEGRPNSKTRAAPSGKEGIP